MESKLTPVDKSEELTVSAARFISSVADDRNTFGAWQIARQIKEVLLTQEMCVLALVGGGSVAGVHEALINQEGIDWKRVLITHGDERVVPLQSEQRNWRVAEPLIDALIARGSLPESNLVTLGELGPDATDTEIRAELDVMAALVHNIDVALLGMGEDGHVASLFPKHPSLELEDDSVFVIVRDSPKEPPVRISVSLSALSQARLVVIGFGDGKAEAITSITESGSIEDIPARIVHLNPESVFVTDR